MSRRPWSREPGVPTATRAHPRLTVALVGVDGAGKSTVGRLLDGHPGLPLPVKTIYMGVNLDARSLMLPTTRLLLAARRAVGPDAAAGSEQSPAAPSSNTRSWRRSARDSARLTVWMLEEWLRQVVAVTYTRRGYLVVFDRHFFADYYHAHIAGTGTTGGTTQGLVARLHGWMLQNAYPKPGLAICLDAPAEVVYARKQEWSVDWLEERRRQYLGLADVLPGFVVIDAARPVDAVVCDVVEIIQRTLST